MPEEELHPHNARELESQLTLGLRTSVAKDLSNHHQGYTDVHSIRDAIKSAFFDTSIRRQYSSQLQIFQESELDRLERAIEACLLNKISELLKCGVSQVDLFLAMKPLFGEGKYYTGQHLSLSSLQSFQQSIENLDRMNWLQVRSEVDLIQCA
jgi:hypothetical protein